MAALISSMYYCWELLKRMWCAAIAHKANTRHTASLVWLLEFQTNALWATQIDTPVCYSVLMSNLYTTTNTLALLSTLTDGILSSKRDLRQHLYILTSTTTNQARTHTQYTKAKEPDSSHLHSQALQNKLRLSLFPVVGNKTAVLGFASRKLPAAGWPIEQKNKVSIVSANLRYEKSRDSSVQCMQLCSRVAYGGGCAEELLLWSEPQVAYSVSVFKQESRCSAKGT